MKPLLYVIDADFQEKFSRMHNSTDRSFDEIRVVMQSDLKPGTDTQLAWSACVPNVLKAAARTTPPMVIVLGHKGVFRYVLSALDMHKAEVRATGTEAELRKKLTGEPAVYVAAFHHMAGSAIHALLSQRDLRTPGVFGRLRAIVEEGGGPFGRLSVLKHNLMRPFASVRLLLQVDGRVLDARAVDRVAKGLAAGQKLLGEIEPNSEWSEDFVHAVDETRKLLELDVRQIVDTPKAFNGWVDELTAVLDKVREEAR